ncbi:pyridoxine 5'-phosphate synthase [Helicobacter canis]|uniref:Pyridoxine 5'-phosphate synthase n=1 Tax=Helicobacter canis TaxID=29419 RepID=A0A5M9QLF4_9HELI|nr:pyridoxine 5'-phosphate synthase [Helicobacter canis]KAA8708566.1 pyridoxine 5'-phosphate synthase [Helicobacter canis]
MKLPDLGLNIDHIATLRQARRIHQPDPLEAVFIAKNAGVQQITIHLREDRRHIHEDDVARIIKSSPLPVNVECASDLSKGGVVEILCALRPHKITLVPEKREEITTEGGLNMCSSALAETIARFKHHNIPVAVFIEPDREAIHLAKELEVDGIELHTGAYAHCYDLLHSCLPHSHNAAQSPHTSQNLAQQIEQALQALESAATLAHSLNLGVFAGHGLNYENIVPLLSLPYISELNIGHSIIARAVMVGLHQAIKDMQQAIARAAGCK